MINIKTNIKAILNRFLKKEKESKKLRFRAHRDIATMLDRWVLRNIKTEGGKVGGWKPFKTYCVGGPRSPYKKVKVCGIGRVIGKGKKRRLDKTAKLLQDTGTLRSSFKIFYSTVNAGIGSKLNYAETHEKGIKPVPKRRVLPNTRDVVKDIKRVYEKYVDKTVEK